MPPVDHDPEHIFSRKRREHCHPYRPPSLRRNDPSSSGIIRHSPCSQMNPYNEQHGSFSNTHHAMRQLVYHPTVYTSRGFETQEADGHPYDRDQCSQAQGESQVPMITNSHIVAPIVARYHAGCTRAGQLDERQRHHHHICFPTKVDTTASTNSLYDAFENIYPRYMYKMEDDDRQREEPRARVRRHSQRDSDAILTKIPRQNILLIQPLPVSWYERNVPNGAEQRKIDLEDSLPPVVLRGQRQHEGGLK